MPPPKVKPPEMVETGVNGLLVPERDPIDRPWYPKQEGR